MTRPKRHHFVPEWYLKGFTERGSGFLYVYDRDTKHIRKQKPKKVMVIRRYYRQDWAPAGVDPNIIEKTLASKLEPHAKIGLDRLINAPKTVTAEDTAAILVYLEFQRIRVPRQAEAARDLFIQFSLANLPRELADVLLDGLLKGRIKTTESLRLEAMRMGIGKLHPLFRRMAWEVVEAEDGCSFVTSDSPVSFVNRAFVPPNEPGPGLLGTAVIFPIDAKHLLIMRHPEYAPDGQKSPIERVPESQERHGGIHVTYGDRWDEQMVHGQNWTMLKLSHRLIAGNSRAVVHRAVENDPE